MLRPTRKTTIIAALGLPGAAMCLWLAVGALRDASALARANAALDAAEAAIAASDVPAAAQALREAGERAAGPCDGPWTTHTWTRALRRPDTDALAARLARAVESMDGAVIARAARVKALRAAADAVDHARTLAELERAERDAGALGPRAAADAPAVAAHLKEQATALRTAFAADVARNEAALVEINARRKSAFASLELHALLDLSDSVLPAPARADEAERLADIRNAAIALHARTMLQTRIYPARKAAEDAASSATAETALQLLDADPELARIPSPTGAAALASARRAIEERIAALRAWEESMAAVERALGEGDAGAAALALGRVQPCDARTREALARARTAYPQRALGAFVAGCTRATDRGDWETIARRVRAIRPGSDAWQALDDTGRREVARVLAWAEPRIDRGLYEDFAANPTPESAARYLRGWPAELRRMAPLVAGWMAQSADPRTVFRLEGIQWAATGVAPGGGILEDRPDAHVEVRLDGERALAADAADIREDERSIFDPAPSAAVDIADGTMLRLSCEARIHLRDAPEGGPLAIGALAMDRNGWRAARHLVVPVSDPQWGRRPHLVMLRVTVPAAPPLAPFPPLDARGGR